MFMIYIHDVSYSYFIMGTFEFDQNKYMWDKVSTNLFLYNKIHFEIIHLLKAKTFLIYLHEVKSLQRRQKFMLVLEYLYEWYPIKVYVIILLNILATYIANDEMFYKTGEEKVR